MKILIIDNFDSFTWNLYHYIEEFCDNAMVVRYDKISFDSVEEFDRIVISPGPGLPNDYPRLKEIILKYGNRKPILGICLGHQAIAETFGARLINLENVWHGIVKKTLIKDSSEPLFADLPEIIETGHYHSWVVERNSLPSILRITAVDENNTIMAISHTVHNVKGIQFHPESIMTNEGKNIIKNWLREL